MKKILSLIGAFGLMSSTAASAISFTSVQTTSTMNQEFHHIFSAVLEMDFDELDELDDDYMYWVRESSWNSPKFKETYGFILDFGDYYGPVFDTDELPDYLDQDYFNEIYTKFLENLIVSVRWYEIYNEEPVRGIIKKDVNNIAGKLVNKSYVSAENQLFSQNIIDYVG